MKLGLCGYVVSMFALHLWGWRFNSCHRSACMKFLLSASTSRDSFQQSGFLPQSRDMHGRLMAISKLFIVCKWVCLWLWWTPGFLQSCIWQAVQKMEGISSYYTVKINLFVWSLAWAFLCSLVLNIRKNLTNTTKTKPLYKLCLKLSLKRKCSGRTG